MHVTQRLAVRWVQVSAALASADDVVDVARGLLAGWHGAGWVASEERGSEGTPLPPKIKLVGGHG